jgi:hypothetical protein
MQPKECAEKPEKAAAVSVSGGESTRLWRKKLTAPAVRAVRTLSGTRLVLRSYRDVICHVAIVWLPFVNDWPNSSSATFSRMRAFANICLLLLPASFFLLLASTQVLPPQLGRHALTHVVALSDVLSFSIPTTQPTTATPAAKHLMLEMTAIFQPSFYPATQFLPHPTAVFSLIWGADCCIFIP